MVDNAPTIEKLKEDLDACQKSITAQEKQLEHLEIKQRELEATRGRMKVLWRR
jgi:hypothetical protein